MTISTAVTEYPPADFREGYIESAKAIPLEEALFYWQREAEVGEVEASRYRCRYFVWGRGQPLLFVHGLSDRARSFVPLIAHLTNSFRCIAYELPTGEGDRARFDHLHHCDLVADVFMLLDHLNVGQACLRFKTLEDLRLKVIGTLIAAIPMKVFVDFVKKVHAKRK